ncbi:hypothetical protein [Amycolatopsis jiangsuensis]|uniref:Uncharacterized protein n=1 Tax=Amycolatopsis jiangsuensis TaxID=1181879 RepID=A0A840J692_9PSEU|nr:hypothetical protein [Amycolatopsis jiangsuensis]MBB4689303.1 hypothetical protein [Amycolatopsis jiangsuensis]
MLQGQPALRPGVRALTEPGVTATGLTTLLVIAGYCCGPPRTNPYATSDVELAVATVAARSRVGGRVRNCRRKPAA